MDLLKDGIIAYPAPLQLQCLMYLVGHLDELSSSVISLLPRHIRHELLLLLPAVDVCQLEGTRVTADIVMDDIWHTLYNNRIRCLDHFRYHYQLQEEMTDCILLSWKDKYFHEYFHGQCFVLGVMTKVDRSVLYAVYKQCSLYYKPSEELTAYHCFGIHTQPFQGLTKYNDQCSEYLIPMRYKNKRLFFDVADLLKILVDVCQFSFKIINFCGLFSLRQFNIDHFQPYVSKLLSTIEGIYFNYDFNGLDSEDLDLNNPIYLMKLKSVAIHTHIRSRTPLPLVLLAQCLTSSTCSLKQLILCGDEKVDHYDMTEIVKSLQSLEKICIMKYCYLDTVPTYIMELFERSSFKELYMNVCTLSFKYLYGIVELFLMSPYSISLTLKHVRFHRGFHSQPSTVLPTEIIPNATQHSKSITITDCDFPPELLSLIPEEFCHYIPTEQ